MMRPLISGGYAVNDRRISQLGQIVQIMKRAENQLDAQQVLSVVESSSAALDMLDDYDHQTMSKPRGNKATYVLSYDECREVIDKMKFASDSDLFGNEKDDSFKGSIGSIYQSFDGIEAVLYGRMIHIKPLFIWRQELWLESFQIHMGCSGQK